MIVCLCHRVSHHDIASAVRRGCDTFDALQDELRVATGCGACTDCARELHAGCMGAPYKVDVALPCRPHASPLRPVHA